MKKTIEDFNLNNKRVIIRCDLNVPIKDGIIQDDNRIKESIKTIKYALDNNAKVIILSHLGRIKSKEDKEKYSLKPISVRLSELLGQQVNFINETRGNVLTNAVKEMKTKEIILVENTRFEDYPSNMESNNDLQLGKYWASLGDIFINDAFATSHRVHASNVGIASNLPSGIGFLIQKELKMLGNILDNPKRPYTVIMGGAKVKDKIKIIDKLICDCNYLLLGGGIANTFLKAMNYDIGLSIYDKDSINYCKDLLHKYKDKIILPKDGYSTYKYEDSSDIKYSSISNIPNDMMMLDVGPDTISLYKKYLDMSETVFWNGPVGVSEFKNFEYGTKKLCEILKDGKSTVIIGGGDSASAVVRFGYKNSFAHISTGGGASLEYIEKKSLPAIDIIDER